MHDFFVDLNQQQQILCIEGADKDTFLQGQLTCDLHKVTEHQASWGAVCNTKGRVITSFLLLRDEPELCMAMPKGQLDILKPHLEKYGVFYKSGLRDGTPDYRRFGLSGDKVRQRLAECFPNLPENPLGVTTHAGAHLVLLQAGDENSPPRYELWLAGDEADKRLTEITTGLDKAEWAQWHAGDLRQGIYLVEPETSAEYTPQDLNYDRIGAVSFDKGCYTGQEIVARMHYRGSDKKRLYPFQLAAEPSLTLSRHEPVIDSDSGKNAGQIVATQTLEENIWGVALLLNSAVDAGARLCPEHSPDHPLQLLTPPSGG